MFDVVSLGEILIDFTPSGTNELGMELFARNPGGAPANMLAMYCKLGGKGALIGKVGDDVFGDFLTGTLRRAGINVSGVVKDSEVPTTLAFVQLDKHGDRSFSFYRKPGADICLTAGEVDAQLLRNCRIFHFGSVSLTDEPCRSATLTSVQTAKQAGAIISYDPNYRPPLWASEADAVAEMCAALRYADIVKVSEEEMTLLTGETEAEKGAQALLEQGASLVLVTMGAKGAFCKNTRASACKAAFDVATVDTTGAGDAFFGALLFYLREKNAAELKTLSREEMGAMLDFSNAAGSLTTTKKGAIPAMPTRKDIESCVRAGRWMR
ncbi:MAG: carbohydrate kinase [Ruthenibacterium sp.]